MLLPKPQKFKSRLTAIEKISSKVYLERFELIEPKEITFLAGQTVMLYVAPGVNRTMSIASPPSEKTSIMLIHDVSPMGVYSKWTLAAKVGDQMELMGPLGNFTYKESPRGKILVATGTGIAPFHSMIGDHPSDMMEVYWGLRHEEDIFWQKEFGAAALHIILSQPSDVWGGKRGHVQDHLFSRTNLRESEYYLCGNKAMVEDVRVKLKDAGVPDTQVKFELFY